MHGAVVIRRVALVLAVASVAAVRTAPDSGERGVGTIAMQSKVAGEGEPLVLIGGGLTGWLSWEPHTERLSTSRQVVRLQPLSVQWGLEGRPLPDDYSVKLEGRAIAAALDARELTAPVDVVAWSFGALAALDFALDRPERVRTLTLIEPPAFWVLHALGPLDEEVRRAEASLRTIGGEVSEDQLERFMANAGLAPPGQSVRALTQWPVWVRHRQSLANMTAILDHHDDLQRLMEFSKPVLLVKGTGSSRYYHQAIEGMASRLPNARVVEFPAGHGPHIVSIDRFLETLAAFHAEASGR